MGDIESMVFLEALRQFQFKVGRENILFMHVSLVPVLGTAGEQKTKPTQHSVKDLRSLGLSPDIIVCRSTDMLSDSTKSKISTFCHVSTDHIIAVHDVSNLYHVPLMLVRQGVHSLIRDHLGLRGMLPSPDLGAWSTMAHLVDNLHSRVEIAMVGKYNGQGDSYLSVIKALKHSAILLQVDVDIVWIDSSDLEEGVKLSHPEQYEEAWSALKKVKGVLIPGGFGSRGVEGKIAAAKYARERGVPCLGVCLGMQVMVIEFARHVLGWQGANSTEFDAGSPHPVIVFMPEGSTTEMGGTMRLGARKTTITPDTLAAEVYGFTSAVGSTSSVLTVQERHRHRYEVNPSLIGSLRGGGLVFSGRCSEAVRMEIVELTQHPYYLGTQYHPEFLSRPNRPSPPFFSFVAASCGQREKLALAGELRLHHEEALRQEASKVEAEAAVTSPQKSKKRPHEECSTAASPEARVMCADGAALSASPREIGSPLRVSSNTKTAEMILPKPLKFDV